MGVCCINILEKEDTYRHNSLQDIVDFTKPSYYLWAGYDNAIERKDTVQTKTLQEAIDFTENYKKYYPKGHTFSGEENTASTPYVGRAREYMQNIIKKK